MWLFSCEASLCLRAEPTAYRLHVCPSLWGTAPWKLQLPLMAGAIYLLCYASCLTYLLTCLLTCIQGNTARWDVQPVRDVLRGNAVKRSPGSDHLFWSWSAWSARVDAGGFWRSTGLTAKRRPGRRPVFSASLSSSVVRLESITL